MPGRWRNWSTMPAVETASLSPAAVTFGKSAKSPFPLVHRSGEAFQPVTESIQDQHIEDLPKTLRWKGN